MILLKTGDGSQAVLHLQGGHLTAWRTATGREPLFLSPLAVFRPGIPIRGGIPIIFPQFADLGKLPKHGFARTAPWTLSRQAEGATTSSLTVRMETESTTYPDWPYCTSLELAIRLGGEALRLNLTVTNQDVRPFSFTAALHTYLRVSDTRKVQIHGLTAHHYRDATQAGRLAHDAAPWLDVAAEVDRTYLEVRRAVELHEPSACLTVRQEGFRDLVVWNPGSEKASALGDLGAEHSQQMVCLEAAAVGEPILLPPGARWHGAQILIA